jgi:hypothetical protein
MQLTAARIGSRFNGYVSFRGGRDSLVGRFTARDALAGTVRVTRGAGATRCDTGPVTFVARAA